jgi:hypothetical protein
MWAAGDVVATGIMGKEVGIGLGSKAWSRVSALKGVVEGVEGNTVEARTSLIEFDAN